MKQLCLGDCDDQHRVDKKDDLGILEHGSTGKVVTASTDEKICEKGNVGDSNLLASDNEKQAPNSGSWKRMERNEISRQAKNVKQSVDGKPKRHFDEMEVDVENNLEAGKRIKGTNESE
ncbi:hypothetical protein POM88_032098 [Heracleum sosnowskyi]|uniref:Uncharacterized protein n=1 Tax=Heracleum sosnowskyi TaxID=360622 RepID=A0AAD8HZH0_9APIA|nr:hypothetical protein POM88_032098 [Heracleum sosnowskyi]